MLFSEEGGAFLCIIKLGADRAFNVILIRFWDTRR